MKRVIRKRTLGRVFFWPGAIFVVSSMFFLATFFSAQHQIADAQVVNFYAGNCEGGWDGANLASGEPQVTNESSSTYTKDNSAYLENKLSPVVCSDYSGTLPPQTYHTRVMVRFSWKQVVPPPAEIPVITDPTHQPESVGTSTEMSTSTTIVRESEIHASSTPSERPIEEPVTTSTTEASTSSSPDEASTSVPLLPVDAHASSATTQTEAETATSSETISSPVSEPESGSTPAPVPVPVVNTPPAPVLENSTTPTPAQSNDTVSWWPLLLPAYAEAEELATSSDVMSPATGTSLVESGIVPVTVATNTEATTSVTESASSTSPVATSTTPEGAQFLVQYTLDGTAWHVLGYVTTVDTDVRLEFPKDILPSLDDISHMKISITPLITIDTIQPVYLDAVWLEVSYAPLGELGVHGISDIMPTVTPFDSLITDSVATDSIAVATSGLPMTITDFANAITAVHGIDERYVLVNVLIGTSTTEVWLFDMKDKIIHRIGMDKAQIGTMPPGAKDGMIFWLNAERDRVYTYDLRTAGSLHEMTLVGNLPTSAEYTLTFPFTSWQVIWRGDSFYFKTRKTGEVFQDENTDSAQKFFNYFSLPQRLPYDRVQSIGGTFVSEEEDTFASASTTLSTSTTESTAVTTATIESASTTVSTSTVENLP
jgi:hypothetical protein